MTGKEMRLSRLFKHSDQLFVVPMDHGITNGPLPGLGDVMETTRRVAAGGADAVVVHKGHARRLAAQRPGCEIIIHLSASTELSPDPNRKELICTPKHALQLGATAVSCHVNLASRHEARMLQDLGQTSESCEHWGLPLLAMMYVRDGTRESEFHPAKIAHAARVAEELGADIVKVNYTGTPETFARVVNAVRIPVVVAGGPRMNSEEDLLATVRDAVRAGARGVALGRNVFQHEQPELLASRVRRVLDRTPDEAVEAAADPQLYPH